MSSIDISSTNDVTSTAASDTNGSFATTANEAQATAHVLTTDGIIRECIKQGFYRNPICNEKLYLHNRGYDSIAPTAFEPYTDVKVLWLEGNGLSTLPCGVGYTQVRPPVRVDPFATELAEAEAEREALSSAAAADAQTSGAAQSSQHVDPNGAVSPQSAPTLPNHAVASTKPPVALPLAANVPPEDRDAFSSLYPTVRQLYLHNNLFRVMPDLSRFERLDSVNLSGNFFSTVEPHCASYDAAACRYRAGSDAEGASRSPSKSLQREREQQQQQQQAVREEQTDATTAAASSDLTVVMASSSEAKRQRAAQLEQQRRTAEVFSVFCEHSPLPEREEAPRPAAVGDAPGAGEAQRRASAASSCVRQPPPPAPEHRNPCSSLRSLNFAGNRLATFEDCLGLLCYRALAVLDLSHNHIADGEALLLILERLPRLQSLKLSGNPLVRSLPRYRKRVLSRCKGLLHLDDRPVFEEERRLVTAWAVGGDDGEEKERHAIQQERAAAEKKRLEDFRRLISRHQHAGDDGPHAEYVNAITTVTALSAAADTADAQSRRRRAGHEGRAGRRQQQRGRHTASDPDSSPTSSDSEEEERDAGVEVDAAQVSAPRGTFATATVTSTGAVRSSGASPELDRIVRSHENKPSSVAARSPTQQQQQRVLSSNQHVAPVEAAPSAARGSNGDDEGEDEGGIFVPGAP